MSRLTGPNHVFSFVCQQTGRCCRAGWKVELDHYDQVNLSTRARGTDLESAVADRVQPDPADPDAPSTEDFQRTYHLAKNTCGACSFLEGDRCGIHAALGPLALPDPCRNFPVMAVQTAWGVEVGYHLACPHAIQLTASTPFAFETRESWDRPLDPQQTRASFIPPPEGWKAFLTARRAAIARLNDPDTLEVDTFPAALAAAFSTLLPNAWTTETLLAWCDDLELAARLAPVLTEATPFLKTWGPPLPAAPGFSPFEAGLAAVEQHPGGGLALAARYLQHTLHTVYFRTGQPRAVAYPLALAALAMAVRLTPTLAATYPKAPLRAAIVLTELAVFSDLRTLGRLPLPPLPPVSPLPAASA